MFPLPSSSQLGHKRPYTDWRDGGACQLPDYAWNDWGNSQTERVLDLIDIDYLREAALYSIDAKLKTKVWDLSQNVDRNTSGARVRAARGMAPAMWLAARRRAALAHTRYACSHTSTAVSGSKHHPLWSMSSVTRRCARSHSR